MQSLDRLADLLTSLPKPILWGILTAYALAHVAGAALPPIETISAPEYGPRWVAAAKNLRAVIAFSPTPAGVIVSVIYAFLEYRAARRNRGP